MRYRRGAWKGHRLPIRSIAPDEVERRFGWMAPFAALDMIASNSRTVARLGWQPTGLGLLTDLAAMDYSALTNACSTAVTGGLAERCVG
jgi:hypothetical protein